MALRRAQLTVLVSLLSYGDFRGPPEHEPLSATCVSAGQLPILAEPQCAPG